MIKISKNIAQVPQSLVPAFIDLFPGRRTIPRASKTTHDRRMSLISGNQYIDKVEYNSRYKLDEIRIALNISYHGKCAYCENRVEQLHIDHYRPKKIYYWLAFSWDNLILACPNCNQNKGTSFSIRNAQASFTDDEVNVRKINILGSEYDTVEDPDMVNPETTDPTPFLHYEKSGKIFSHNRKFIYTIETCKIDRNPLNDERRALLDIFSRDIRSALLENKKTEDQQTVIKHIVQKFIRDSNDINQSFLGFRRFAIREGWMADIIKSLN